MHNGTHDLTIAVTTLGTAGNAVGSTDSAEPISGFIEAVSVDYHASAPGTTNLVLSEDGGIGRTLLTLATQNTDKNVYPRIQVQDAAGSNIAAQYTRVYVYGYKLKVALTGCDALTNAAIVRLVISDH